MRVLHCIPTLDGGGAERQLAYLCGGLVDLGVTVDVAALSASDVSTWCRRGSDGWTWRVGWQR
jgi:hypothetical protein